LIILGIDPGVAVTGYGAIEIRGDKAFLIEYGAVRTDKLEKKELRLTKIHREISDLIERLKPDAIAVELLFFNRNTKTALIVGEARGVALLAAGQHGRALYEYTPLQVKECLTGYGRVKKNDLREIVQIELDLEDPPKPIDASDALAIALCHHFLSTMDDDF
jgi:crossover junction endodeoxyribonuclease RuvC